MPYGKTARPDPRGYAAHEGKGKGRALYRRHAEARFLAAWELQPLLWSLGYADELLDEGEIAATVAMVWPEFFTPIKRAA